MTDIVNEVPVPRSDTDKDDNKPRTHAGRKRRLLGAAVLLALGSGYLVYHGAARPRPAAAAAPTATPVTVSTLSPRLVHPFADFSGRIDAVDYAEIRPQVSGRITEIRFHDGQRVNAGDVLFVIDPRPYEAAVTKAEADLATAVNNAKFAKAERDRGSQLVKTSALSQEIYDQRVNADAVAEAADQISQRCAHSGANQRRLRIRQSADLGSHQPGGNHSR